MGSLLLEKSEYHNPLLNLSDESKLRKVQELAKEFILPVSKLQKIMDLFGEEMRLGIEANPSRESVFYMCNTFVTEFPDPNELSGDVLSMDLGGSNLRIILTRLKPGKEPEFRVQPYDIPEEYRRGKPETLFDFLAVCIEDFLNKNKDIENKRLPFGFTFSFGYDQLALNKGIIKEFSIQTDIPEAIGNDAVQYLQEAIDRKGLNIDVLAILNDTTAVLLYGMYLKPDTQIGFILGSGTNTCYMESVERIKKIDPIKTFGAKTENVILNCENGFLGDNGSIDFAKSRFDKELDEESLFPHRYSWEKLIGGVFLGDVVRRCILALIKDNVCLGGVETEAIKQKDSIKGPDISKVEESKDNSAVTELLNRLGYSSAQITDDDIEIVRYFCALIGVRNALLCAANLTAVIQHIDKPVVRVAVDGSLYKKHPKLHTLITDFIGELVPNRKVELFLADDGSGKGSAFVAAVAAKHKL